ncbi:heterocyst-inhibiting protein PatX [Scytonema sp. NUACC21]
MRAAVSLLIVGFLCGSFAINNQAPNIFLSKYDSPQLTLAKTKQPKPGTGKPGGPKNPPYRGSGRRLLMEYISTTQSDV